MSNQLQLAGSQSKHESRFVPIYTSRFFQGLWTQRSPLRDAGSSRIEEKFYGARNDALIDGLNVEITNRLTIARRPGLSVYNSQTFPTINSFYEFRQYQSASTFITVLADTANIIYDATGPTTQTNIFTKSPNAGNTSFQSVGNVLYFGDGVDQEKYYSYNGTYLTQLWGIASATMAPSAIIPPNGSNQIPTIMATATTGIDLPYGGIPPTYSIPAVTTNATGVSTSGSIDVAASKWSNLNGAGIAYAICSNPGELYFPVASFSNFGFNIPLTAVVNGVTVTYSRYASASNTSGAVTEISLLDEPGSLKVIPSPQDWTTTPVTETYGSNSDLWNQVAISPAVVNSTSFGVQLQLLLGGSGKDYLGIVTISVNYTIPGNPAVSYTVNSWSNPSQLGVPPQSTGILTGQYSVYDTLLVGGFVIPAIPSTNIINGIAITFTQSVLYSSGSGPVSPLVITLYSNGIPLGSKTFDPEPRPTTDVSYTIGGPTDLWGSSAIDPSRINSSLSIQITPQSFTAGQVPATQFIGAPPSISLYTSYPSDVTVGTGGNLNAAYGYTYEYVYGNSFTGHVSSPSPVTVTTGPLVNATVSLTVQASTDPQVNQIRIFRTTDGGAIYYELPNSPVTNTTQTIVDNAFDPGLGSPSLQVANIAPNPDTNDPPPTGLVNLVYFQGAIWGSIANSIYYSRLYNGTLGVPTESFPPLNYFTLPHFIIKFVASAVGLLIFTISDIHVVTGNGTSSSPYSIGLLLSRIGLSSPDALAVNGAIIYMMSADAQFLSLDPNSGVTELGFPIGDLLDGTNTTATIQPVYNPATAYVTWHVAGSIDKAIYLGNGSTGWFRLTPTAAPETGFTWSPFAEITGGCHVVQSVEVISGTFNLLVGPIESGMILKRDLKTNADNGYLYPAFATIGNIVLAQPGEMAELAFITTDCMAIGASPIIYVLLDEVAGTFEPLLNFVNDPPALATSTSLYANRYYFSQNTDVTAWCRHLQIKFDWPPGNNPNELLTWTVVGAHFHEG